jgi:hypothetical protein
VRRWLFNLAAAVSAVLFCAIVAISVLGVCWTGESVIQSQSATRDGISIISYGGALRLRTYPHGRRSGYSEGMIVPWLPLILFGILPSIWLVKLWRRKKRPPGTCASCGYDLRASKDRCPECGTAIPPAAGEVA